MAIFVLGNDYLHLLTKKGDQELRADFERFNSQKFYSKYFFLTVHLGYWEFLASHNRLTTLTCNRSVKMVKEYKPSNCESHLGTFFPSKLEVSTALFMTKRASIWKETGFKKNCSGNSKSRKSSGTNGCNFLTLLVTVMRKLRYKMTS